MKKVLDSAPCDNANSCAFDDAKQILREFGYKLGRYDVLGNKGAESALDSATRAIKNNMRVNRVILLFPNIKNNEKGAESNDFLLDSAQDSATRRIYKQAQNLTKNGVEIIVFLKNSADAKFGIDFWRKFGIVYLLKDSQNLG